MRCFWPPENSAGSGWRLPVAGRRCRAARRLGRRFDSCRTRWPATVLPARRTPGAEGPARRPDPGTPPAGRRAVPGGSGRSSVATSVPSTSIEPDCGRGQLQDLVQRGRLARSGFADDAQRAALLQFEADAVDRTHLADLPAEHHTLGQLVGLDQIPDSQHDGWVGGRVGGGRLGGHAVDLGGAAAGDLVGSDARRAVVGPDLEQLRFGGAAVVDGQRAARRERAAGRQRGHRRRRAGYRHQPCALGGVESGYGAE